MAINQIYVHQVEVVLGVVAKGSSERVTHVARRRRREDEGPAKRTSTLGAPDAGGELGDRNVEQRPVEA